MNGNKLDVNMLTTLLMRARDAMQWFVDRVNRGEVRSVKTYARFVEVLAHIDAYLCDKLGYEEPWIGVDLDGTLAEYHGWKGPEHIGPPIPVMMKRVKKILAEGETVDGKLVRNVKIFTARAAIPFQIPPIRAWLDKYGLFNVGITCVKTFSCVMILDDRCQQIKTNEGVPAAGPSK